MNWMKGIVKYGIIGVLAVLAGGFVGGFFAFLGTYALVGTVIVSGLIADMLNIA